MPENSPGFPIAKVDSGPPSRRSIVYDNPELDNDELLQLVAEFSAGMTQWEIELIIRQEWMEFAGSIYWTDRGYVSLAGAIAILSNTPIEEEDMTIWGGLMATTIETAWGHMPKEQFTIAGRARVVWAGGYPSLVDEYLPSYREVSSPADPIGDSQVLELLTEDESPKSEGNTPPDSVISASPSGLEETDPAGCTVGAGGRAPSPCVYREGPGPPPRHDWPRPVVARDKPKSQNTPRALGHEKARRTNPSGWSRTHTATRPNRSGVG